MRGGNIERICQLFIRLHRGKRFRQAGAHVVIHIDVIVAVKGRNARDDQKDAQGFIVLDHKTADSTHIGQKGLVRGLFNHSVHHADHTRQQNHRAQNAQYDAFAHDNAKVTAQSKAHEADGDEAGHRSQAAAQNRGKRLSNGAGHRLVLILRQSLLLLVAVPEEDGIIQRHAQL